LSMIMYYLNFNLLEIKITAVKKYPNCSRIATKKIVTYFK
jgi:hypothetical protein